MSLISYYFETKNRKIYLPVPPLQIGDGSRLLFYGSLLHGEPMFVAIDPNKHMLTMPVEHIVRRVAGDNDFTVDFPKVPKDPNHWIGKRAFLVQYDKMVVLFHLTEMPVSKKITSVGTSGIPRVKFKVPDGSKDEFLTVVVPSD